MAQNLTEVPTTIKRNINYFVLFKTTDTTLLSFIVRTFRLASKEKMMKIYEYATEKPKNFLYIKRFYKIDKSTIQFLYLARLKEVISNV